MTLFLLKSRPRDASASGPSLCAALLCLALGPGLATAETTPLTPASTTPPAAPAQPAVKTPNATNTTGSGVLLLGDSMMKVGVGPELKGAFGSRFGQPVTVKAKSATGLARPDAYDWPKEVKEVTASWHYGKAVVMLGTNDCQSFNVAGQPVHFGTEAWNAAYGERLQAFLGQLCSAVDEVLWIGLPPMRNAKFNARIMALNVLLEAEVKKSSCAKWLPAPAALADAKGHFRSHAKIGKRYARIRAQDGIHMTAHAGQAVAQAVATLWPVTPQARGAAGPASHPQPAPAPAAGTPPAAASPALPGKTASP